MLLFLWIVGSDPACGMELSRLLLLRHRTLILIWRPIYASLLYTCCIFWIWICIYILANIKMQLTWRHKSLTHCTELITKFWVSSIRSILRIDEIIMRWLACNFYWSTSLTIIFCYTMVRNLLRTHFHLSVIVPSICPVCLYQGNFFLVMSIFQ